MKSSVVTQEVEPQRDGYFDSLKFVLITLVVLGHTLEANLENQISLALYNTIYLFHMPLFIFITGYFSKKHNNNKKKIRSWLTTFETLVVFQTIHNVWKGNIEGVFNLFFMPRWTMWYLYSVLAWKIFIYIMPDKLLKHSVVVITLATFASLVVGVIKIDLLSFHRTCVFFPFFLMGYYCRYYSIDIKQYAKRIPSQTCLIAIGLIFIILFGLNKSLFQLISGSIPYGFFNQSDTVSLVLRCFHLILATCMSICVLRLVKEYHNSFIRRIGSDTLFFYMTHSFVVLITRQLFISFDVPFNILSMLFLFLINYALVCLLSIIPYSHLILNPVSKIINKQI